MPNAQPNAASKPMIGEFQVNQPVDSVFLLAKCVLRSARTGKPYLDLEFSDRTGRITGRFWDATESLAASLAIDDFVQVKGRVESYQGQLQVNVHMVAKADTAKLRLGDFLPQSEHDPAQMMRRLTEILGGIEDPDYRRLAQAFLADETFCAAFRTAPAATSNHHAYLGGLLEHTLSMAELALKVLEHYRDLRRDILLLGVLLHDIGKTRELAYKRTFQYTDAGNLVGHITLGVLMLEEEARKLPDFPAEKLNMLRHMILSHHGVLEYGSPKLPMFAEAMALHYLDNLDAKLRDIAETISEDRNADPQWTDYSRSLGRKLYKG
ncbi:MAG TPA: HD domain-containing protein [Phycisphaerae bacterium]|nr:HD domain-containing protein [Phycisphaerae bacterium]